MTSVLVVDDDRTVRRLVEKSLAETGVEVITSSTAEEGLAEVDQQQPDVLLVDIMLPKMNGLEFAQKIRELDAKLPVIFITAMDDSETAIEAMKLGAYEYLVKPLDVHQVQDLVERALDMRRLMQAPVHLERDESEPQVDGDLLVGKSPKMLEVYKQIGRVAAQDVTVLIRGESGTGKELIARAIYQHSHRRDETFLAVNCAALSETLLESELFGHEKGAFTGADRRRIGKFEQCNGGTIFLDEIGDMSPLMQSKVLRLLQEQKFERVGGRETIFTDIRVVSATNRDLEQMIEDNEFRLDLYHRINAFEIYLPPLRERGDDIELLAEHFITRFNRQLSKDIAGVSEETMEILRNYRWPGNIRQLQAVLRKAILMATGSVIVPEFLPPEILNGSGSRPAAISDDHLPPSDLKSFVDRRARDNSDDLYAETLAMMERYLITRTLRETDGNQSQAAKRLGITRGSLRNKIKTLGISIDQIVELNDAS